jgi:hypothetical protein
LSYFTETFHPLVTARGQSRSAKSVEVFGWLILFEGTLVVLLPHFVARNIKLAAARRTGGKLFPAGGPVSQRGGYALHCQRSVECRGVRFRIVAGPAACAVCHADLVVSRNYPRSPGGRFFNPRFLQLSMDTKNLARRVTEAELNCFWHCS